MLNGLMLLPLLKCPLVHSPLQIFVVKAQLKCHHLGKSLPDSTGLFRTLSLVPVLESMQSPVDQNKLYD